VWGRKRTEQRFKTGACEGFAGAGGGSSVFLKARVLALAVGPLRRARAPVPVRVAFELEGAAAVNQAGDGGVDHVVSENVGAAADESGMVHLNGGHIERWVPQDGVVVDEHAVQRAVFPGGDVDVALAAG